MSPLYRDGVEYALTVSDANVLFDGTSEYCVDIAVEGCSVGFIYIDRDTHVIADCMDAVNEAVAIHKGAHNHG